MPDKFKVAMTMYRKSLRDLSCNAIEAIIGVLLMFDFILFHKDKGTNVTRYYHQKQRDFVALFDPRGGEKNSGCGMPCIRIYKRLQPDALFLNNFTPSEFSLIDTLNLIYFDGSNISVIVEDVKDFLRTFNKRIRGDK